MKPSRAAAVLKELLGTRWPVFLWGPPGAGKSSIVREVAREVGRELVDVRASLLDPTDLRGIPTVVDGRAHWSPPSFLPSRRPRTRHALLRRAERRAPARPGQPLPAGAGPSRRGVRAARRAGASSPPATGRRTAPSSSRCRLPWPTASSTWTSRSTTRTGERGRSARGDPSPRHRLPGAAPRDCSRSKPGVSNAFATPRSWEIASDAIGALGLDGSAMTCWSGIVGEGAAVEFVGLLRSGPERGGREATSWRTRQARTLPEELGPLYALVSYVVARAAEPDVLQAARGAPAATAAGVRGAHGAGPASA